MTQGQVFGLYAAPAVRWFLEREPDVRAAVQRFIAGQADTNKVVVALPPTAADQVKASKDRAFRAPLPEVVFELKMIEMDDHEGVEVSCNELDMIKLEVCHNEARLRSFMPKSQAN